MTKRDPKNGGSNPGFVSVVECRDRHLKIDLALFGPDGRGGMVKDIGDIKGYIANQSTEKKEKKEENKALRALIFSIIGGAVVALINYVVLHH